MVVPSFRVRTGIVLAIQGATVVHRQYSVVLRRVPSGAEDVGVAPGAFERQPPGRRGHELVDRVGTPGALLVRAYGGRVLEQWRRQLPEPFDALGRGEQRPVAPDGVVDEPLVGLQHGAGPAGLLHRE